MNGLDLELQVMGRVAIPSNGRTKKANSCALETIAHNDAEFVLCQSLERDNSISSQQAEINE